MAKRMVRSDSLASLNEVDMNQILNPKINTTDKICSIINWLTLLPTIIYNIVWLYLLKNAFEDVNITEFEVNSTKSAECLNVFNSLNTIFVWVIVSLTKSIIFILFSKFLCSVESDCNILCLFIKGIASYLPSLYFIYSIDYTMDIDNASVSSNDNSGCCSNLLYFAQLFYIMERYFVILFTSLLALIPIGSILMLIKELWRSRGYIEDKNN